MTLRVKEVTLEIKEVIHEKTAMTAEGEEEVHERSDKTDEGEEEVPHEAGRAPREATANSLAISGRLNGPDGHALGVADSSSSCELEGEHRWQDGKLNKQDHSL